MKTFLEIEYSRLGIMRYSIVLACFSVAIGLMTGSLIFIFGE